MPRQIGILALAATLSAGSLAAQSHSPAQPSNTPASRQDTNVLSEVYRALGGDHALQGRGNNIQAEVHRGVVKLSGTVPSEAAKELAGNDLVEIEGVRTVLNNLAVVDSAAASAPSPAPPSSSPAAAPQSATVTTPSTGVQQKQLAPPATLAVRVDDEITTKTAKAGDTFHGEIPTSIYQDGIAVIPAHTPVTGRVVSAKPAGRLTGYAELTLELVAMRLATPTAGEQTVSIVTAPLSSRANGRGANTAGKTAGGAGLGAVIGALAGGGTGAAIGAASGGALGAGANALIPGQQIDIKPEALLRFTTAEPISVSLAMRNGVLQTPQPATGTATLDHREAAATDRNQQ